MHAAAGIPRQIPSPGPIGVLAGDQKPGRLADSIAVLLLPGRAVRSEKPELHLRTDQLSVEQSVQKLLELLEAHGVLAG